MNENTIPTRDLRLPSGQSVGLRDGVVVVSPAGAQHHYQLTVKDKHDAECLAWAATYPQLLDIADQMARMEYHMVKLERIVGKLPLDKRSD